MLALLALACGGPPLRERVVIGQETVSPEVFAGAAGMLFAERVCGVLGGCLEDASDAECVRELGYRVLHAAQGAPLPDPIDGEAQLAWIDGPASEAALAAIRDLGPLRPTCEPEEANLTRLRVEWRREGGCIRLAGDPTPCEEPPVAARLSPEATAEADPAGP